MLRSLPLVLLIVAGCAAPPSSMPMGTTRTTRDTIVFSQDTYQDSLGGASLDFALDGLMEGPLGIGFGRDFIGIVEDVMPGSHHVLFANDFDHSTVYEGSITTSAGGTMLWLMGNESHGGLVLIEGAAWATMPAVGHGVARAIHSSVSLGPIDVYVVARGATIAGETPTWSAIAPHTMTDFVELPVGDVTVVATLAGTSTMVGVPIDSRVTPQFALYAYATENCSTRACTSPILATRSGVCLIDSSNASHCYAE